VEAVTEMRKIIKWAEPPTASFIKGPGAPPGSQWDEVAAELRANPGRSALIYRGPRTDAFVIAATFAAGRIVATRPAGSFAVTRRSLGGPYRRAEIYAKYVGTEDDAS
jgi:hypothetical protein